METTELKVGDWTLIQQRQLLGKVIEVCQDYYIIYAKYPNGKELNIKCERMYKLSDEEAMIWKMTN